MGIDPRREFYTLEADTTPADRRRDRGEEQYSGAEFLSVRERLETIWRRGPAFLLDELYSDRGLLDYDYREELEKMVEQKIRDDYKQCDGCGAQIVFLKTQSGKWNPVDAHTVEKGDEYLDLKRHVSHFSTCTKAGDFRNKDKAKRAGIVGMLMALILWSQPPAYAYRGERLVNGVSKAITYPFLHPKRTFDYVTFPIQHPLQFGAKCDESGANGLINFISGCANVGTTAIVGAKKF